MYSVAEIWNGVQTRLFPLLEAYIEEVPTAKQEQLVAILEVVRIEEMVPKCPGRWQGRPSHSRQVLARAFLVKAVYDMPTTEALVEMLRTQPGVRRICGYDTVGDVPSAATFSRAFREFADLGLCDTVHQRLVEYHLGAGIVAHVSRDSTAIKAREKPARKKKAAPKGKRKPGRLKKGEHRPYGPEPTRLQRQTLQSAEEALSELPTVCDVGVKKNSKGKIEFWIGYKAHIDTADFGLPVNVVTTSASLHDSQVAIPMARITAKRITSLYGIMDAAYDAKLIHDVCKSLNHRPIIDINRRTGSPIPFDAATAERYKERSTAERTNSRLKDEFGGRHLRVRGHAKVHAHIMFGILALFADQLLKLVT